MALPTNFYHFCKAAFHNTNVATYVRNAIEIVNGDRASSATPITSANVGTKNGATVSVVEYGNAIMHRTILTCTATPVTITDDANVAQYGGVLVYTFPQGVINLMGAVVTGTFTAGVTGTYIDNWDGDVALGSVTATTGNTLVSTEATWLQSTAVSAGASDKIGVVDAFPVATQVTESGARWYDGTTTAGPVYLNFLIDDDVSHTAGTGAFTGTIALTWCNLGDN
jgi:hypothetical protein